MIPERRLRINNPEGVAWRRGDRWQDTSHHIVIIEIPKASRGAVATDDMMNEIP